MKKIILSLFAMSGLLVSCITENLVSVETAEVVFDIDVESVPATRAISDGTGATQLMYGVFNAGGELIIKKAVKNDVTQLITEAGYTMTISLTKGQSYNVVFWAQNPDCNAYTVSDDMQLTIDYEGLNNDESRDAFYGVTETFKVEGNKTIKVILRRPFAQVNVGAFPYDMEHAEEHGVDIAKSSATIQGVANTLNMLTGEATGEEEVKYSLNDIPDEELLVDVDGDKKDEVYTYLSMSYLLASAENTTHAMSFVFTEADGNNPIEFSEGLQNVPICRNWRTNIVGQILTGDISFNVKIDPIYYGDILNSGGLYYNFIEDVTVEDKVFAFNTDEAATFTSENNNTVTMEDVTFSGRIQYIAMGEYRDKGNYVEFTNVLHNVKAENMVVTHSIGIANVEPIDYMAPLFFLRGVSTLNNCVFTGTTSIAPERRDYNGDYHEVIAYDCGVPNLCVAEFNNCTVDKLYAWSHSQITLNNSTLKYIRCSTHNHSHNAPNPHLTIGDGTVVDEIFVSSSGTPAFKTIDGKKTLVVNNMTWSPSLIIKAGATVKRLDMNGRSFYKYDDDGNVIKATVIIEAGATVKEIVNTISGEEIPYSSAATE